MRQVTFPSKTLAAVLAALFISSCGGVGGDGSGGIGDGFGPLGCALDTFSPNYLQETDPSTGEPNEIHWWAQFPLRIYFPNNPTIQGMQLVPIAMEGFNAWSAVAGRTLAVEVANEAQADVVVVFENVPTQPGGGDFVGQTSWTYSPSTFKTFSAEMTLRTWNNMTVNQVANGFRRTAQHEFGHVLFLAGHSPHNGDTMFPFGGGDVYTALTTRDQNSLKTAYCGSFADRQPTKAPIGPLVTRTITCPAH